MGYVKPAAFFCTTTEMVKECTLNNLYTRHTAPLNHIKDLADTKPPQISVEDVATKLDYDSKREALSLHE